MDKHALVDLNEKGLNIDYANSFTKLYGILSYISVYNEAKYRKIADLEEEDYLLKNIIVKSYTEAYPLEQFHYSITNDIQEINNCSFELNVLLKNESLDYYKMYELMNTMYMIINDKPLNTIR